MWDKAFKWNPSNCECECNKSCDVGEYLDYKTCKCRNKLGDKLVEKCIENINGNEMIYNETLNKILLNDYKKVCGSCTLYIVFFALFLETSTVISVFSFTFIGIQKRILQISITNINDNFQMSQLFF